MKRTTLVIILLAILLVSCLVMSACVQEPPIDTPQDPSIDTPKYTVTWQNWDGNVLELDENVEYGKMPSYDGETPTKEGNAQYNYTFSGWSPSVDEVRGNVTYVAQFTSEVNKYTVTWINWDGAVLQMGEVEYGTMPTYAGSTPTKEGNAQYTYTFTGWTPSINIVTGDVSYTAQFLTEVNEYTVTWQNWDGSVLELDESVEFGATPSFDGATPTRERDAQYTYTFSGWDPSVDEVTCNVTYVAQYSTEINKYTVTWQNWDGSVLELDENVEYGTMPTYDGATPTRERDAQYTYTFAGWEPSVDSVTGNVVYTVQYSTEINKYTVTWQNWDGNVLELDENVEYGIMPTYNGATPTRERDAQYTHIFSGWDPSVAEVTGNIIYTAQYSTEINKYIVTWKNWDGTVLETDENVELGAMPTFDGAMPTKPHDSLNEYTFAGWSPKIDNVNKDAIYTALFSIRTSTIYTIEYDVNGGTGEPSSQTKNKGQNITLSSTIPTNGDYVFIGWFCAYNESTYNAGSSFDLDANVKLNAVWGYNCETCDASGKVSYSKKCTTCSGSGTVKDTEWSNCYGCGGDGKLSAGGQICSSCRGFGGDVLCSCSCGYSWWANQTGSRVCSRCSKSVLGTKYNTCSACGGKGSTYYYTTCSACGGNGGSYKSINVDCSYCTNGYHTAYKTCETCGGTKYIKNPTQSYNVTLKVDENTYSSPTVYYAYSYKFSIPSKVGYTFVGWFDAPENGKQYTDRNGVSLKTWDENNNKTLYAHWIENYSIIYNLEDGDAENLSSYNIETPTYTLINPTRAGYKFIGWSGTDIDEISMEVVVPSGSTGNREYTANWEIITYTITYESNGGEHNNPTQYTVETDTIILADPTREHYDFAGWESNGIIYSVIDTCSVRDYELTAKWIPHEYSITYELNGGTASNPDVYTIDSEDIILSEPTKVGYTFIGWILSDTDEPTKEIIIKTGSTGNRVYTATWQVNTYNYTLKTNSGEVSDESISIIYGQEPALPTPEKSGFTFGGWFIDVGLTVEFSAKTMPASDLTIYACWKEETKPNNFSYDVDSNNFVKIKDYLGEHTSLVIPTHIGGVPVTTIGVAAFADCTGLTSIVIPDSVTTIGSSAFYSCDSLTNVTFGENSQLTTIDRYAFYGCKNLTSIVIPDSVTTIGSYAFYNCDSLTSVTFGENSQLTTIDRYAFYGCKNLTSIEIPDSVTTIDSDAFYECTSLTCVTFGENSQLTTIGDRAFSGCDSLTSIVIPDSVTTIGESAFEYCTSLTYNTYYNGKYLGNESNPYLVLVKATSTFITSCEINEGCRIIMPYAFHGCTSLTSVTIGESVTTIGSYAFEYCYKLVEVYNKSSLNITKGSSGYGYVGYYALNVYTKEGGSKLTIDEDGYIIYTNGANKIFVGHVGEQTDLIIPNGIKEIYKYAFYNYTSLTSIVIPDSVTTIGSYAFYSCDSLTSVTFGENSQLTTIGNYAFYDCDSLTSIVIPDSVTTIGNYAFYDCDSLTSVTFGENSQLTTIGDRAFRGCDSLTSIVIPDSVTTIGNYAFYECDSLTSVTFGENSQLTTIGSSAFYRCYKLVEVYNKSSLNITKGRSDYGYVGYYALNVYTEEGGSKLTIDEDGYIIYTNGADKILVGYTGTETDLIIPDGIKEIYKYAFYNCTSLTSIVIPDSVTTIGKYAFEYCYKLVEVYNKSSLNITKGPDYGYVGYYALNVYTKEGGSKLAIDEDGYIIYTNGANKIFVGYVGEQTDLIIPDGIKEIYKYAFYNCDSLTSIVIPDSVTTIGSYAFYNCDSLTSVTFGENSQLTTIDRYAFYGCKNLTSIEIPDSVTTIDSDAFYECTSLTCVTFGENSQLTTIGDRAFSGCDSLTSIVIPDSVTTIGSSAFSFCDSLTSIVIPDSVTTIDSDAFFKCTSLTSVTFGENSQLTTIGEDAFSCCYSLTSIVIPDNVTTIGNYAFDGCTSLISVTFGENSQLTTIGEYAFFGCTSLTSIVIPDSVTTIGSSAFEYCYKLVEVYNKSSLNITKGPGNGYVGYYALNVYTEKGGSKLTTDEDGYIIYTDGADKILVGYVGEQTDLIIPNGITKINQYAFYMYSNLTSVTFGENSLLTTIGNYAFYGCKNLTSIEIPDSVTSIGNYAFYNCYSLTSIVIPDSVTTIGSDAFEFCTSLTDVYYTGDIAGWCGISFGNSYGNPMRYADNLYIDGKIVEGELVIPDSVTTIGNYAFRGCDSLTSIVIPDSVTTIGDEAFYYCTSLTSVTIGENSQLTTIGSSAFSSCDSLTSIVISDSVTTIGDKAFYYCTSLTSVTIGENSQLTTIGPYAFSGCYKLVEVYNKSSLNITKGSSDYGYVGYYALNVYTEEGGSKLTADEDGYIIYTNGANKIFVGYVGEQTDLIIPDGIKEIYNYAFRGCDSLTSIVIPDSVTTIGNGAFNSCDSLTSIVIPDSVTTIGDYAFSGCDSLTSVTFEDPNGWYVTKTEDATSGTDLILTNASTNATYLKSTYYEYYWYKK